MGAVALVVGLLAAYIVMGSGADRLRDRISGSETPVPVVVLQQGATSVDAPTGTWTIDVALDQVLIVDAASVVLDREDEGSRIDNANRDRILLAAEGPHRYALTVEDGRWVLVAAGDGRRQYCAWESSRDGSWGVRYRPAVLVSDPC